MGYCTLRGRAPQRVQPAVGRRGCPGGVVMESRWEGEGRNCPDVVPLGLCDASLGPEPASCGFFATGSPRSAHSGSWSLGREPWWDSPGCLDLLTMATEGLQQRQPLPHCSCWLLSFPVSCPPCPLRSFLVHIQTNTLHLSPSSLGFWGHQMQTLSQLVFKCY